MTKFRLRSTSADLAAKPIEIENTGLEEIREVHSINIGNPHAVTFVNNIHNLDVDSIGSAISKSQEFPEGVNVGFCQESLMGFSTTASI